MKEGKKWKIKFFVEKIDCVCIRKYKSKDDLVNHLVPMRWLNRSAH